ncbi:hypothetical protein P691DRAFT_801664 [Macrolepiota fuliginosa MF-IS2]|uniref:NAD(P)-binding domain-containing protein n=1 Tax=Macrolepiota fuliginosa MF-IS2 TaxID=1400762 RepID=A0A9P5XAS3_9AGAR|nr:hypothetical protein P691DRAFT_801664 [Macrolepiota fuliginosa MF-IS2]
MSSSGTTPTNSAQALTILSIGASRNIGYYASLKFLQGGATVTFLLRNPSVFDNDTSIQPYVSSGHARLIKGDALVKDDVARAWAEAGRDRPQGVDYLLFTVGGTPKFVLSKGFTISPPNLVTVSLINALSTLPPSAPQPKIITISSTGLTPTSHSSLPILLKPLYGYFLIGPHADKLGGERVLHHCTSGWSWNSASSGEPAEGILPSEWEKTEGLPKESSLSGVVVIRPSLLTDGECLGDAYDTAIKQGKGGKKAKKPYKVSAEKELGGYTVSRKDVAHFVLDLVLNRWAEFENKIVNISY